MNSQHKDNAITETTEYIVPMDPMEALQCESCQ